MFTDGYGICHVSEGSGEESTLSFQAVHLKKKPTSFFSSYNMQESLFLSSMLLQEINSPTSIQSFYRQGLECSTILDHYM